MQFKGTVVAISVQDLQNHDYSIHVAFDETIKEEMFKPLVPPEPVEEELPEDDEDREEGDSGPELEI